MMTPQRNDASPDRARDLREQARRAWMLLGGRSSEEREARDDDDDDDLPRPNAVVTLLLFPRLGSGPMLA